MRDSLNLCDTLRGRMTVSKLSCKIPMMKITPTMVARILIYTPSKPSIERHDRFDVDSCEIIYMHQEHMLEQNNFLLLALSFACMSCLKRMIQQPQPLTQEIKSFTLFPKILFQ